jgi:hypothetical protein
MKKNYTDSDIQKMLVDLAELIPEIDPNDSEWREFLREFIAARPEVQLNEQFAQELRVRILDRAHQLQTRKRGVLPRWLQLSGMFVTGAAVCALILVPILNTSKEYQAHDEMASRSLKMVSNNTRSVQPKMTLDSADTPVEALTFNDVEEIPEFEIAPMMAKGMAEPIRLESLPNSDMNEEMAAAGTLNTMIGEPRLMMAEDSVAISSLREMPQLSWEDMPSDAEILRVATEFFQHHNFDSLGDVTPRVDKWWENQAEMDWKPEFAPDRVGVVFTFDGGEVRIDVDTRTLEVVWMSWSRFNN